LNAPYEVVWSRCLSLWYFLLDAVEIAPSSSSSRRCNGTLKHKQKPTCILSALTRTMLVLSNTKRGQEEGDVNTVYAWYLSAVECFGLEEAVELWATSINKAHPALVSIGNALTFSISSLEI